MKRLKKWLLGIITAITPVVIAACYGPVYQTGGMVSDAESQEGIPGIEVTCIDFSGISQPNHDGIVKSTVSNTNGYYEIGGPVMNCDIIKFEDGDGNENGLYDDKTVFVNRDENFNGDVALKKIGG